MTRKSTIFLAFTGQPINQSKAVFEVQDGYECWDLKKLSFNEFIDTLKQKIPPINGNVLRNYILKTASKVTYGITEQQYNESSWGLLIPHSINDAVSNSYAETIFLLNLYSPTFLYPLFFASNFGIMSLSHDKPVVYFADRQNQSRIFKTKEFIDFFRILLPQSQYGTWQLDRVQKWNEEDWRLFAAGLLYSGLKDYDTGKNAFGWQRESADMASILESLFTAGDSQNEEVGYRLRKRMAVLLAWRFPNIEKDVKKLYSQRSAFVHGSFFAQIAKDSKQSYSNLPVPDFTLLYKQKEYVRLALVSYLHLAKLIRERPMEYSGQKTVISALEQSVIDIELRKKLIAETQKILFLLSKPGV